jgi:23S rRNA-/tRNA-specific pseudouridylate synthase
MLVAEAISAQFAAWAAITRPSEFAVCASDHPQRIGKFSSATFASLDSTSQAMRAVRAGRVLVDGTVCDHAAMVRAGDEVTLLPPDVDSSVSDRDARAVALAAGLIASGQLSVPYEEAELAVVHKPASLHTKPFGARLSLDALLPGLLTPPPPALGPLLAPSAVHRLDRRVQGLVVVAKSRRAAAELSAAFRERRVHKRYRAIALGAVDAATSEIGFEVEGRAARTRVTVREVTPHVQAGWVTTLDLWPETGRRHQLRRHCADIGHPLLGDDLYAPSPHEGGCEDAPFFGKRSSGLFLQACAVDFDFDGRHVSVEVPEARKFARFRERARHGWQFGRGET